ncbi:MAG: Bor family protein [Gemmatimonadaceae bacterium]
MRRISMLLAAAALCGGCYHVTVLTGLPAGSQTLEKEWQHSFIVGIVPPAEVNPNPPCAGGVAKVETERSFLNGLVGAITYNIYTPIHVTVTCAGS